MLAFQVRALLAEVQVEVLWEISIDAVAVSIPSSRRGSTVGPGIPESISTSKINFVPRASTVSCQLQCSPGIFSASCSALKQTMFRPHQVFIRRSISSPPATTDPSVRQLGCSLHDRESTRIPIHQACTKVTHMECRANIGVGFCRRVAL